MSKFFIPVILTIEAETTDEALKSVSDWADEIEFTDMPSGTQDVAYDVDIEQDDDGHRIIYIPQDEEDEEELNDEDDDFNDSSVEDLD